MTCPVVFDKRAESSTKIASAWSSIDRQLRQ
jgi:hypothetical protein